MAIRTGVIGNLVQSMGGITFTNWKGRNVAKQQVPARNSSNSPAQAAQRRRFRILAKLGGSFGPAVRIGFRDAATEITEQNVFASVNYDLTSDNGTVASITYPGIKVSSGTVLEPLIASVTYTPGPQQMVVSVADNSNGTTGLPSDKLCVLVLSISTGETAFYSGPATRATGMNVQVPYPANNGLDSDFHVYIYMKRATATGTSDSRHSLAA